MFGWKTLLQGFSSVGALRRATTSERDAQNDRFAFAVMSGQGTAQSRVPLQLVTWLRNVRNLVIIGAKGVLDSVLIIPCISDKSVDYLPVRDVNIYLITAQLTLHYASELR